MSFGQSAQRISHHHSGKSVTCSDSEQQGALSTYFSAKEQKAGARFFNLRMLVHLFTSKVHDAFLDSGRQSAHPLMRLEVRKGGH